VVIVSVTGDRDDDDNDDDDDDATGTARNEVVCIDANVAGGALVFTASVAAICTGGTVAASPIKSVR
jgi:hypothetical protein